MDRESLRFWRVTPGDLAELAAGGPLDPPPSAARSRSQAVLDMEVTAQEHVATSDEPVVNTLWKVRSTCAVTSFNCLACLLGSMRLKAVLTPAICWHRLRLVRHGRLHAERCHACLRTACAHAQASPGVHVDIQAQAASCRSYKRPHAHRIRDSHGVTVCCSYAATIKTLGT